MIVHGILKSIMENCRKTFVSTLLFGISHKTNDLSLVPIRTFDSRIGDPIGDNCHISKKPKVPNGIVLPLTKQWCTTIFLKIVGDLNQTKPNKKTFCRRIFPPRLIPEIIDKYPKIILKCLKMNHFRYSYHYFSMIIIVASSL